MWRDDSVRYLAGLWSFQLELSLTWSNFEGTPLPEEEYGAPTWSWASANGPVNTAWYKQEADYELLFKVLEVYTEPVNDLLGAVKGGYVKLSGPLCSVQICPIDNNHFTQQSSLKLTSTGDILELDEICWDTGRTRAPEDTATSIDCVLAGIYQILGISPVPMSGLVLRSTGRGRGQFIRIGSFHAADWKPRSKREEEDFLTLEVLFGDKDADPSDFYRTNDYMRVEEASKLVDLPPQMYESKMRWL